MMTLIYKFKKENLERGIAARPKIYVRLTGPGGSLKVIALIDSGSDATVIPEGIARFLGLDMSGEKTKLQAYRESNDVVISKANIIFLGRRGSSENLNNVPVLISLKPDNLTDGFEEEDEMVLGVEKIFDEFEITFKKAHNKIILKRVGKTRMP